MNGLLKQTIFVFIEFEFFQILSIFVMSKQIRHMSFKYFQSSKKKQASDCSVRCIMAAEGLDWNTAFGKLVETAYQEMDIPCESSVIEKTLKKMGYEKHKADMVKNKLTNKNRRICVREFAKMHKRGTYILSLTEHVVCVKNGHWYDTWDSGEYKVLKYWEKTA